MMDAFTAIAAIPRLADLISSIESLASEGNPNLAQAIGSLDVQTNKLRSLFELIDERWKARTILLEKLTGLGAQFIALERELVALASFLTRASALSNARSLLSSTRFALSGTNRRIGASVARVESITLTITTEIRWDEIGQPVGGSGQALQRIHPLFLTRTCLTKLIDSLTDRASRRLLVEALLQPSMPDFIPKKLDGTFEWVWSHPAVLRWTNGASLDYRDHILCIHGPKGCGKSVLVSSMAEDLRARGKTVAFFSFWTLSRSRRHQGQMLRTLLWQLLQNLSEDSFDAISRQVLQEIPLRRKKLVSIIAMTLEQIDVPVFLFVDGIGESMDDWAPHSIKSGFQIIRDIGARGHPKIRILMCERLLTFPAALWSFPVLPLSPDLLEQDVTNFIAAELENLPHIQSPVLKDHVRTCLHRRLGNPFLWFKLVFDQLREISDEQQIRAELLEDKLPHSLDDAYNAVFLKTIQRLKLRGYPGLASDEMNRAERLLGLMLDAAEPFNLDAFSHAYAVLRHPRADWEDRLLPTDHIIDVCRDFAEVSANRARLRHTSALEFLMNVDWRAHNRDLSRRTPPDNRPSLATVCLDYLRLIDLGYPIRDDSFSTLCQNLPFLPYVTKYGIFHTIHNIAPPRTFITQFRDFIASRNFCKWIEYALLYTLSEFPAVDHVASYMALAEWYKSNMAPSEGKVCLKEVVLRRTEEELWYRQLAYGAEDPRTESWELVKGIVAFWLRTKSSPEGKIPSTEPEAEVYPAQQPTGASAEPTADESVRTPTAPMGVACQVTSIPSEQTTIETPLASKNLSEMASRIIRTVISKFPQLPFKAAIAASNHLPILTVIGIATVYYQRRKIEKAMEVMSVAIRRTKDQNTWDEAAALGFMGDLYKSRGPKRNFRMAEQCYRTATNIMRARPRQLHNDLLTYQVSGPLMATLIKLKHKEEAVELGKMIAERLANSGCPKKKDTMLGWWLRNTWVWPHYRMVFFAYISKEFENLGCIEEAVAISKRGAAQLALELGPTGKMLLDAKMTQGRLLASLRRHRESADMWQDVVTQLKLMKQDPFKAQWERARQLATAEAWPEVEAYLAELRPLHAPFSARGWRITHNLATIFERQGKIAETHVEITKLNFTSEVVGLEDFEIIEFFKFFCRLTWPTEENDAVEQPPEFGKWLVENIARNEKEGTVLSLKNITMIGSTLRDLKNCDYAARAIEEVVNRQPDQTFSERQDLLNNRVLLTDIYYDMRAYNIAAVEYASCQKTAREMLGAEHRQTRSITRKLALSQVRGGKTEQAVDSYISLAELYLSISRQPTTSGATTKSGTSIGEVDEAINATIAVAKSKYYRAMALWLQGNKAPATAIALLEDAIRDCEDIHGSHARWKIGGKCNYLLGEVNREMGELDEAKRYFAAARVELNNGRNEAVAKKEEKKVRFYEEYLGYLNEDWLLSE
jgi:hypothetical protein